MKCLITTKVIVNEFKQKSSLIKIVADIIVQRETQKRNCAGEGGKNDQAIRELNARKRYRSFS